MKLKENQLRLIRHLAQYEVLTYDDCLQALDESGDKDRKALSYLFRPLTKNRYLSKRNDGTVAILAKGRALYPKIKSLVTLGGGTTGLLRNLSVSRTALCLGQAGVESHGSLQAIDKPYFIPSACWRKLRPGILSTTRFVGMLLLNERQRLAVYDIGDGQMEWQMKAERSLFYRNYREHQTQATGMLLVCSNGCGTTLAQRIIRQTMWQRKQLIETKSSLERTRPVQYVRAPIRLSWYFEHVYFCQQKDLPLRIAQLVDEQAVVAGFRGNYPTCSEVRLGDYENWPERIFVNYACDLLKYIYFFAAVQAVRSVREKALVPVEVQYIMVGHKADFPIMGMYPDVVDDEGVKFCAFKHD